MENEKSIDQPEVTQKKQEEKEKEEELTTEEIKTLKMILKIIMEIGEKKGNACPYRKEGYCAYWRWSFPPVHFTKKYKQKGQHYHIFEIPIMCAFCNRNMNF